MEHDLTITKLGKHRIFSSQIIVAIQSSPVLVKTFQSDSFTQQIQKVIECFAMSFITKKFFLSLLSFLHVNHTKFVGLLVECLKI